MAKYILKLKQKNNGRQYFGGADMEDMWFATKKDAWSTANKKTAAETAQRFGLKGIRDFTVEKA